MCCVYPRCVSYSSKMNDAGGSDDDKANDDGGNSNIESIPAQPPRSLVVTLIIAVPGLRIRNHCYSSINLRIILLKL